MSKTKFADDLKIIFFYLRPYKKQVGFLIFLATIAAAMSAVIPVIYGKLFDQITKNISNLNLIIGLLLLWLILTLLGDWLRRIVDRRGSVIGINAAKDLLVELISYLLNLPLSFHKESRKGKVMSKVYQASNHLDQIMTQVVFYSLPKLLTVVVALIIALFVGWPLALGLIVVLCLYTIATIYKTQPIINGQEKLQKAYEDGYGELHESIYNIPLVKSFTNENVERQKTIRLFEKVTSVYKKFMGLWIDLSAWQQTIFGIGFVLLFAMGIYFVYLQKITTGEFITFVGFINLTFTPFRNLAHNYRWLKKGAVVIQRARKILEKEPEPYEAEGIKIKQVQGAITFNNVSFRYENKAPILKNISFSIQAGEVVALVGESGVGKTTLADLISRYYIPKTGKILLDGQDIQKLNLTFLREQIAIVPQEITMFNNTIKNNIRYAKPRASENSVMVVTKAANAHDFIWKFPKKYNQVVGERGIKLSTGQKQRVAIARALLRDPKILILDEATSSLDSVTEKLVQEALKRLIKNRTTFIIAHRLSTITHADKIIVLEKGRVAEVGKHQELLAKKGVYYRLYQAQKF